MVDIYLSILSVATNNMQYSWAQLWQANKILYSALLIYRSQFYFKNSRKTPYSSPLSASYCVSFMNVNSDQSFTNLIIILCTL